MPESDTFDGLEQLRVHLSALEGLRDRMEAEHIARPRIEARVAECKKAIAAERRARAL